MAKRRRLDPAPLEITEPVPDRAPETKSMFPTYAEGVWRPSAVPRPPVASVAADGAQAAALAELAAEMSNARTEGRLVQRLPLDTVDESYLLRDRLPGALDPDEPEMAALIASLAARGQQTAIEVADLGAGNDPRFGLISGWRRLSALRHLGAETVLAIARPPGRAQAAYLAMVEENEIRAGLSHYERARIVTRAADSGVFADDRAALAALFSTASRPRRSKIGSFTRIVRALDGHLRFPARLNERLGLRLATGLDSDPGLAQGLISRLQTAAATTHEVEARVIAAALDPPSAPPADPVPPSSALRMVMAGPDRLVVQGPALTDPGLPARLMEAIKREFSLWAAHRD